ATDAVDSASRSAPLEITPGTSTLMSGPLGQISQQLADGQHIRRQRVGGRPASPLFPGDLEPEPLPEACVEEVARAHVAEGGEHVLPRAGVARVELREEPAHRLALEVLLR